MIQRMVDWDKHHRILQDWQWKVMNEIVMGKKPLNDRLAWGCKQNLKILKQHGFTEVQNTFKKKTLPKVRAVWARTFGKVYSKYIR